MEKQKLPNVTLSLVLGIISFIACCCSAGIGGLIFSGIAYFLISKDEKLYAASPEKYDNYGQLKTAKIVAIIGLALAVLSLIVSIIQIQMAGGWNAYMEQWWDMVDQIQNQ